MAILTRDQESETLVIVHPVRKRYGEIQMKKLKSFKDLAALARQLKPERWQKLVERLEQKHADLKVDWDELHQQARLLVAGPLREPTETDLRALELRGHLAEAAELLQSLRFAKDGSAWEALRCCGDELRALVGTVATVVEGHRHPEEEGFRLFHHTVKWTQLLAEPEASFGRVERARVLFRQGQKKAARELLQEARELDPFDPDIDNSEGVCSKRWVVSTRRRSFS